MHNTTPLLAESRPASASAAPQELSDADFQQVIADFLAQADFVENIVALFRQEPRCYAWTGLLLSDERLTVRLGVFVLFEYLLESAPEQVSLAVAPLMDQLQHPSAQIRGDAAGLLGLIATPQALAALRPLLQDTSPQVVEVVRDILEGAAQLPLAPEASQPCHSR